MSTPLVLIQLVSEQTMQNLLPILRLKPARVVHLVTPKTAAKSASIRAASKAGGLQPEFEVVQMSPMPGVNETVHTVSLCLERAKQNGLEPVVNFTGGTKLMSIGSYSAAQAAGIPSLYVDTQDSCFVDGATSPRMNELLQGDWSFTSLLRVLQVHTLAIANGVARITGGKPWRDYMDLASLLFEDRELEQNVHAAFRGPDGLIPGGREPRSPRDWLDLMARPLTLGSEVGERATSLGLIRSESNGRFFLPDRTREELTILANKQVLDFPNRFFKAVAPLQQAASFLSGGWWEVIVADGMDRTGLMRDLRWSIQVGSNSGPDLEEDIVALSGVELVYVSCKRGGPRSRLLPLLEEIRARAASMGGSFNRRFLAILIPPMGKVWADLEQRSRTLGIRLITGQTIFDHEVFSSPRN